MGAAESSVQLYLGHKGGTDKIDGVCTIVIRRNTSKICKNFERVFYLIKYDQEPSKYLIGRNPYYNVSIWSGTDYYSKGERIFRYYCSNVERIITAVHVYYSFLLPNVPLIIEFLTKDDNYYKFTYNSLKTQDYAYSYDIKKLSFTEPLKSKLPVEYRNRSGNKKLKFILEKGNNTNVSKVKHPIENDNKFKKIIYRASCIECKVFYSDLFEPNTRIDPEKLDCPEPLKSPKNFIDPYYLSHVKDKELDGIIVYYTASANQPENVCFLVEFIYSCDDKSQYVRIDKYSTCWVKRELDYTDENDLSKKLEEIRKDANGKDIVTYILEKKENYLCVDVKKTFPENTKPDSQDGYSKYTQTPKRKSVKPNIVFNLQILKLDGKEFTEKIELLETYFIKNNEKKEDDTPFLVMIKQVPSTSVPAATAVELIYISMPCDDPKEWKKIGLTSTALKDSLEKIEKIPKQKKATEKIKEKIRENGKEVEKTVEKILEKMVDKTFDELRKDACKILDEKAHPPAVPPKPTPGPPTAPPKTPEIPTKYELTLSEIIGITIGAVVFSSVAGTISYGVYWYRTTIMLLT